MYEQQTGVLAGAAGLAQQSYQNQAPVRMSEVQQQVMRSQKATEKLTEKLKSLYERLVPVLRSTGSGQAVQEAPKPTLVGHAMALSNHNDQLEMLDAGLAEILDRLEL